MHCIPNATVPFTDLPTEERPAMSQYERIAQFEAVLELRDLRRRHQRNRIIWITALAGFTMVGILGAA
jgi:hypothetical protein